MKTERDRDKILIIDDSPVNIQILNEILCDDYAIHFTTNGEKGLELAVGKQPDLILLGNKLPDMDGYQLCTQLKAADKTQPIPVIFITEPATVEEEEQAMEAGASDFINKPISAPVLKMRIRNYLELKRQSDSLEQLGSELARKNRQQEMLARQDGLTGLANRSFFDEAMSVEIRRAGRSNTTLSLILCNIDHFKSYNDHYGHLAGDECLRSIGALLRRVFQRISDLPARYGGEEFAIILPDTPADKALMLAETLCRGMRELAIPHEFSPVAPFVTISIGVISSLITKEHSAEWFTGQADKALFRSKDDGRNKVTAVVFDEVL